MAKKARKQPELLVTFDTNALFTQIAHQLLRQEVCELIDQHSQHHDLSITWHLPEVVVEERRHQMAERASDLLPQLTKVENILGHNLGITRDVMVERIESTIARQMADRSLKQLPVDTDAIDWPDLIQRSVRRLPPFDPGAKEKGFRDAVIAETFLQLVDGSPTTPQVCRVILVSGDELLARYIRERTTGRNNVHVLTDCGELDGLINTLASEVTEEFVSEVKEKAGKFFFVKDDLSTFYFKEDVGKAVRDAHPNAFDIVPAGATGIDQGTWWIAPPVFVRKEKQRVYWYTPITVDVTAYRVDVEAPKSGTEAASPMQALTARLTAQLDPTKKIEMLKGKVAFEVHWSVNVSKNGRLTSPKLAELKSNGVKWATDDDEI